MPEESWLPRGFELKNGARCGPLAASGEAWQIIKLGDGGSALAARPELAEKWVSGAQADKALFDRVSSGDEVFLVFQSGSGRMISSVRQGPYPERAAQAMRFAAALRKARQAMPEIPLDDALFLEQPQLLLPTYTGGGGWDDRTVLGTWLSGGVIVSAAYFDRLCRLLGWLDPVQVDRIVSEAAYVSDRGAYLSRTEPDFLREEGRPAPVRGSGGMKDGAFTLPGRPRLEQFFNEHVVEVVAHEEKYRRMGIGFPSGIVLHGPSGCGKTYAAERLVEYLGWPCYRVDSGSIGSSYIHDTGKKIARLFEDAEHNAPSVVLIDEMEAFLTGRSSGSSADLFHNEEVAEFLRRIPAAAQNRVLVIAMTNLLHAIDPAILRRGRFDHLIEVTYPSKEETGLLLRSLLKNLPVADDVDLDALSEKLKGRPVSDVAFAVKEAGRITARADRQAIDAAAFREALDLIPRDAGGGRRIGF